MQSIPDDKDIKSDKIKDNETWNTCPKCERSWKDYIPTPGLIHRTRLCQECINKK